MDCKLSILIPVHAKHIPKYLEMMDRLNCQIAEVSEQVEILKLVNSGEKSIGKYRQELLENASGKYIVFIDADDQIDSEYISIILNAIQSEPDCIGIKGIMTTNGGKLETWEISKDLPYDQIRKGRNIYHYRRFTNHLSPIKREIALQIGFEDKTFGEDYDYALRLKKSRLLKTEVKIAQSIYHYDFWTNK